MSTTGDNSDDDKHENSAVDYHMMLAEDEAVDEAAQFKQKAAEFRATSARLRQKSRHALKKAERLDRKAKDLEKHSRTSTILGESLHFQTLLRRLRRKDKRLVCVSARKDRFQPGYGKELGEALQSNTAVIALELDLSNILSGECQAQLCMETRANDSTRPQCSVNTQRAVSNEVGSLLQFLKKSTALEYVIVDCTNRTRDLAIVTEMGPLLLDAMAESKSIKDLTWKPGAPAGGICKLLQKTQSLQELNVTFDRSMDYHRRDHDSIAAAFGANKTLQRLKLRLSVCEDAAVRILAGMRGGGLTSSLRELVLTSFENYGNGYYLEVSQYLNAASATLRTFEMTCDRFGDLNMETLLSGLVRDPQGSVPSIQLSRLALLESEVHIEAAQRLAVFLQTPTIGGDGEVVFDSSLRELSIGCENSMGKSLSRHLATSVLMALVPGDKSVGILPTVGSQLDSLCVHAIKPVFLHELSDNANRVRLKELHLYGISKELSIEFSSSLPSLTSIRKLTLKDVASEASVGLIQGLKLNGSVIQVATNDAEVEDFTVRELRLIEALCTRNRLLPGLLATKPGTAYHHPTVDNGPVDTPVTVQPNHFPMLLTSSEQVRHKSETMVMRGLLSLNQFCGLSGPSK